MKTNDISELIQRMRLLEKDHGPDGWPAVQMKEITALCDEIEEYEQIFELYDRNIKRLEQYFREQTGFPENVLPDTTTMVDWYVKEDSKGDR